MIIERQRVRLAALAGVSVRDLPADDVAMLKWTMSWLDYQQDGDRAVPVDADMPRRWKLGDHRGVWWGGQGWSQALGLFTDLDRIEAMDLFEWIDRIE